MHTTQAPCPLCSAAPCHNVLHRVIAATDETVQNTSKRPHTRVGVDKRADTVTAVRPRARRKSEPGIVAVVQTHALPDVVVRPSAPEHKVLSVQSLEQPIRWSPYMLALRKLVDDYSIAKWAARYLATEVYGLQARNTSEAKSRDLLGFVQWFVGLHGHGEMAAWLPRHTQAYLNTLERSGRAPTTVNRVYATLRRFVRWAHEQPGDAFAEQGLPTRGVKLLVVEEPDCKKVAAEDIHQLFLAADALVKTARHARARPRRDRAILALLYYTGLRVSEVVQLTCAQYQNGYLVNVARKGKARSQRVYVVEACRNLLEDYMTHERPKDDAENEARPLLLPAGSQSPMARQYVNQALQMIARQASKHHGKPIYVHPHRLRHTFGAAYRDKSGSDTETAAALGHTGLQYVGRYVRKTDQERETALESMFNAQYFKT